MTTSISVPEQQERTRDMGSVDFQRPPIITPDEALAAIEKYFGTTTTAKAVAAFQHGLALRNLAADPSTLDRDIALDDGDVYSSSLRAAVAAAIPFPGLAAA